MVVCEVSKESRSMKTVQERSKPLHNFILPTRLRWGNQRFLRCMKVDSNGEILSSSDPDRTRSSASDADSDDKDSKFKTLKSLPTLPHSIERNTNTDKRKIAVPEEDESAIASAVRPWNLRTRRAACKAPNGTERSSKLDQRQHQLESLSLHRTENPNPSPKSLRLRGLGLVTNQAIEKKERCKFSTSLARDEIKEDFFVLTGNNLPRRPKKRPRIVQRQLNNLFPGFWLREVTTDSYRVPDELVEIKKK